MARRTRQRRTQVDLAGIQELTGPSIPTIRGWYRRRATTGFPEQATTDRDGRAWWWLNEVSGFWSRHLADRAAIFTAVDRAGDPDNLLTAPQATRALGYKDHRSLTPPWSTTRTGWRNCPAAGCAASTCAGPCGTTRTAGGCGTP